MTAHEVPFLWCILQAALLSTLGVGAAWLFARKAPAAGATAAAAAAAMIAVVTLLIPVRVPKVEIWTPSHAGDAIDATAPAEFNAGVRANDSQSTGGLSFDVEDLAARLLTSLGAGGVAEQEFGPLIETCVVGLFAFGAAVGTLQFLWSLCFVARLRRDRKAIADGEASRLFTELKARLKVARAVELCESRRIASPAVIGWRRPIVLLPVERADWTEEQLRATLAHELAHVVRGDFFWRFVAGATQAIHFFHPLVHLLTRRLTLMQELATDRLAATAAGGSATYLRALSELAIRLDDPSRLRAEPIVLPALSSNLMRRIVMLRSKEGSVDTTRRRLTGVVAAGFIAMVGAGTTALRGTAEAVAPTTAKTRSENLFARSAVDLSLLGGPHQGLFVVRLGELSQRPALASAVEAVRELSRELWPTLFGAEAPTMDFTAIEYVAGTPQLMIRPWESKDNPGMSGQMMVGCGEVVVRFRGDVAWESWIKRYVPGAAAKRDGDLAYVEFPTVPSMGKAPMLVAARDSRTLIITWGVDRLRAVVAGLPNKSTAAESVQWDALDGGMATFVADDSQIDRTMPTPKAPRAHDVLKHVERYSFGLDLDPTSNQAGIRVVLTCADEASAAEVNEALAKLIPQAKATIEAQLNPPSEQALAVERQTHGLGAASLSEAEREYMQFWVNALASCTTHIELQGDGATCVRITATAPFPSNLIGAQELAARAPTVESEPVKR